MLTNRSKARLTSSTAALTRRVLGANFTYSTNLPVTVHRSAAACRPEATRTDTRRACDDPAFPVLDNGVADLLRLMILRQL